MIRLSFSKPEKYIFIAAFIIIISGLAYHFIIEPFFKKWNSIDAEIVAVKARLKENMHLLENKNTIIKEYNAYAGSPGNISGILSYIERQSESLGIKTADIRSMPVVKKELYREYLIELKIEGRFTAINKFMSRLIKAPMFITVKKFRFKTIAGTSSHLKGTLVLSKIVI
ncbi:type 4a pilus biogenesis protein PilO [Candidatus Omnitrophota bacterium]